MIEREHASTTTLQVRPLPATNYMNVSLDGSNKEELVELLDINSKLINARTLSNQMQQRIDVSGLSSGIYFVKIKGDENLIQRIIIKKR